MLIYMLLEHTRPCHQMCSFRVALEPNETCVLCGYLLLRLGLVDETSLTILRLLFVRGHAQRVDCSFVCVGYNSLISE